MTTDDAHEPSRYCYLQGCDSPACEQANYRYMSALRLDHHRGHRRLRDAAPVTDHISRLVAAGWNCIQIAEAGKASVSAVRALSKGQPSVSRELALAILNIHIGPPPVDDDTVDATGSIRRIRALSTLGHTLDDIGGRTGMSRHKLGRIIHGRYTQIAKHDAALIASAYRHLATIPGDSALTRTRAKELGWHGPLVWDDIDNPKCKPEYMRRSEAKASTKRKVYADPARVAALTAQHKSAAEIAQQLGCHKRTVVRIRGRVAEQVAA